MDPERMPYHKGWFMESADGVMYQLWDAEGDRGWRAAKTDISEGITTGGIATFHEASSPYLTMKGAEFPTAVRQSFERVWLLNG